MDTTPPSPAAEVVSLLEEDGDAAWERIIADPRPRPRLEAFLKSAVAEGSSKPQNDHLFT